MSDRSFDTLIEEAVNEPIEGWDFSYLDGRRIEQSLPWDYPAMVRERMCGVDSMLDMGTGGGEILSTLAPFPPKTLATECYARNVWVARNRLEALGIQVIDTTADQENAHLPFGDEEFDLIINRHEIYQPEELKRILKPGGVFLTQQCGGYGEVDLIERFTGKGTVAPIDWTANVARCQLENSGFEIVDVREVYPVSSFLDVGAVVYYLKATPWLIEDFSVERYRSQLLEIHKHILTHGNLDMRDQRFLIEVIKPD